MAFDINELIQNPQFQTGLGLMGAASPKNRPMLDAFTLLQGMQQRKQEEEKMKQYLKLQELQEDRLRDELGQRKIEAAELTAKRDRQAKVTELFEKQLPGILERLRGGQAPAQMPQPYTPQENLGGMPQGQFPTGNFPMPQVSGTFNLADKFVAGIEGGFVPNDAGKGPTNQGVNQRANPDIDVRNAPTEVLQQRRRQYWDAIQGDQMEHVFGPQSAMIAYDAAINQGQDYAKKLVEKTGGDPTLMLYQRRQDYRALAKNPLHAENLKGWEARLNQLEQQIKGAGAQAPVAQVQQQPQLAPYKEMQVLGGVLRGMSGDVPGAIGAFADVLKPDYEGQKIQTERGGLVVRQQAEARQRKEYAEAPTRAQEVELSKGFANQYLKLEEEATKATARKSKMEMLRGVLEQVNTNRMAPVTTEVRAWLKSFGFDVAKNTPAYEAADMMGRAMAMELRDPSQGAGSPGQITEWEQKQFQTLVPGIGRLPQANKIIAKAYIRQQERIQTSARIMREYRKTHGKLDEGVYTEIEKFKEVNPLFDKEDIDTLTQASPAPGAPARIKNDAEYNQLPSGSHFIGPDGKLRRKP